MILDLPPKDWKRPAIPARVKRIVLQRQNDKSSVSGLPLEPGDIHFDHRPSLRLRRFDTEANDTIPPANDPAFIEAINRAEHDVRTNGRGGARRISTYGSDTHEREKLRDLAKQQAAHRAALAAKAPGKPRQKSRRWPKRKFPSRKVR